MSKPIIIDLFSLKKKKKKKKNLFYNVVITNLSSALQIKTINFEVVLVGWFGV